MKIALFLFLSMLATHAEIVSFPELFADPTTRAEAIATLTPGTRDHFFHTALDHQLAGREKEYAETLTAWRAAAERKDQPISNEGMDVLEIRRIISSYDTNPKTALAELKNLFDLKFDDTKPDSAAENLNLPTTLDPALISVEAFRKEAELKRPGAAYAGYGKVALEAEMERVATFTEDEIRWFTGNFTAWQHPKYVDLLVKALSLKTPYPTDNIRFDKLALTQMDALRTAVPRLSGSDAFNAAYLKKLTPAVPAELVRHLPEHAAFLAKCAAYVKDLPASQNSLKNHVLYHHLRLQEMLGNFPKDDLLAYLALPRHEHPIIILTKESRFYPSDDDFTGITQCPRINRDVELVERYLSHFLATSETPDKAFVPFLKEKALARLHARARLLAGINAKSFAPVLGAEEYKTLREEVRVGFAPGAPEIFPTTPKVSLPLDLKNTPKLLVRVYEIASDKPAAAIDLDGLVPHHSRDLTFPHAPIVLHRENIALPELEGAGTWIVEFVADRVSARALIRKGNLTPYITREASGQLVRVFDETSAPVQDFNLTLGEEKFTAKDGKILVPDSANQPVTSGKLEAGKLSLNVSLESRGDEYALETDFLLAREQLIANQEAKLHLRTQLTNHSVAVPLEQVKKPTLILTARLLGGVTTERVIADPLQLAETNEIPFLVPADLLSLTLTLSGTIDSAVTGEEKTLTASTTYHLNGQLETPRIATALFSPTATGHQLHLRGRNGEPLPQRPVNLLFAHDDYRETLTAQLRTDDKGIIDLGELTDIKTVTATSPDIGTSNYTPPSHDLALPSAYIIAENAELKIPTDENGARTLVRLSPSGSTVESTLLTQENSQITIRSLPPGDYLLKQDRHETKITVLPATAKDGLLVTADRILPVLNPATPTISEAKIEGENVLIHIAGASSETRVTVIAKRYAITNWIAGSAPYPFEPEALPSLTRSIRPSSYLTERMLSDEVRYILDRRAAKTFPGSMLPRPGQLLYRWTPDDLDQETQDGANAYDGNVLPALSEGGGRAPSPQRKPRASQTNDNHPTVIDFLQHPAAVKFNLKGTPTSVGESKEMVLKILLADFQGAQFLEIIAADTRASDKTYLPLAPAETPLRDRRIARPLDPKSHHLATRFAAALAPGAEAEIENLLDADWRAFTTLEETYQFLLATTGEEAVRDFAFLTKWPTLEEKEKLALLADHHCHELHLFLSRKDPEFFGKFIKPFLVAKTEPQFIDDYLLARDLEKYLRPLAFSRLNAAEKALLAQALPARKQDISRELDLRWKTEAPSPDAETILFSQTLKGADLSADDSLGLARNGLDFSSPVAGKEVSNLITSGFRSGDQAITRNSIDAILNNPNRSATDGVAYITDKLRRIVIPRIDFEDTTLEEAIDFLRLRSTELDTLELDPDKKGVNFVIRNPRGTIDGQGDSASPVIKELRLRNVPLEVALKYIADATKMRVKSDDFAVTLVPQTETGEDLSTRTFRVPMDFASRLAPGSDDSPGDVDPFADSNSAGSGSLTARPAIVDLLKNAGILMPEGSSATLGANGVLLVTGPSSELDKVEQLTDTFGSGESVDAFADDSGGVLPPLEDLALADEPTLRFPDRTKLWLGANYYKHRNDKDETGEELIPLNRFWLELSAWDGKAPFTSPHFNACTHSAADALMCLAMLDLPFTADRPEVSVDGSTLKVKARAPMLLFYKDTRKTENVAAESPLLVRQSYHPLAEPFRTDAQNRKIENTVTGEFRTGVPYGLSLVVTNPTGTERRIETLAQIPAGAIPLASARNTPSYHPDSVLPPIEGDMHAPETLSTSHQLAPYGVIQIQLAFYFPAAGDYTAYPFHVSENEQILAHAEARVLRVSADPAPEDSASWLVIARDGTSEAVLNRLSTDTLSSINLDAILWRMKDKAFFLKATAILRKRLANAPDVFLYGILHDDATSISDALLSEEPTEDLGQWFSSKLITITPQDLGWETMEFDPLVNARAHRFGDHPRLTHEEARAHYESFLATLKWKAVLTSADELAFTYHLFLQDRIEEALARFAKIKPAELADPLQYDYLHALALFYQEKPEEAKGIAAPYLAKLPPGVWRERFQNVTAQAEEISKPIAAVPEEKKESRASLEMERMADGKLLLKHTNLSATTLSLYNIDLEVLFSKDPFLKGGVETSLPPIAPNRKVEIPFAKNSTETPYELPEDFRQGNILVAAESGNAKQLKILDSRLLEARVIPKERTVQVIDTATGKALAKTYVKVFAESRDGTVTFHKDGYTDLRGKFDYLSHTAIDPSTIKRLAILVSHPEKGTRTIVVER